jgi:translation initiation factor IF-1
MNSLADIRIPFRPTPQEGKFSFKITEVFHDFKSEGEDFYLNYKTCVPAGDVQFKYENGSYFLENIPRKITEKIRASVADEVYVYPELNKQ